MDSAPRGGHTTTTSNGIAHVAPDGGIVPELLTTPEAARMCNVGERTLWRWSRCGIAPEPIKIGMGKTGAVRYRRDLYLNWIRAGCPRVNGRAGL
jgi:predicted DNA-binding transcriptional regulator AlpA